MFNQVVIQMGFWTAWLVIPAIFELSPAIVAFLEIILVKFLQSKNTILGECRN
ncbi:hypothetical protein [Ligilactobacillus salivarius]|uniref:hypothetical protein n=1 Tax=Ligilactobacillus salivarius TaxID=1624 RepID=UPI0022E60414|nr:hypothetical protein [Ligilactobacillus salivarius]